MDYTAIMSTKEMPGDIDDLVKKAIVALHEKKPLRLESPISDEELIGTLSVTKVAALLKVASQNIYRVLSDKKKGKAQSFLDFDRLYQMLQESLSVHNIVDAEIIRSVIRQRYSNLLPTVFPEVQISSSDTVIHKTSSDKPQ